ALASGRHDDARRLYREALAADPPNLYAHYRLAESWLATNGYAEAREWCERGLAIDPHQIGLLELLAETASRMGDPLLSVQCYEAIATRNPEVENLEKHIANQLPKIGRTEEAIAAYDRALARTPDLLEAQSNRLFVLNYVDLMAPEELSAEHRRWGLRHEAA